MLNIHLPEVFVVVACANVAIGEFNWFPNFVFVVGVCAIVAIGEFKWFPNVVRVSIRLLMLLLV